jgi:hypothetical protein
VVSNTSFLQLTLLFVAQIWSNDFDSL